jgi:hypothetical protein
MKLSCFADPSHRLVLISPHTVVQNLLPVDVNYQLVQGRTVVDSGTLKSGGSVDVLHASSRLALRVALPGKVGS